MNRYDLFDIIGETPGKYVLDAVNIRSQRTIPKRIWLIAAIIALMLFLMGSAIAALIKMETKDVTLHFQSSTPTDGETEMPTQVYEGEIIQFQEVHDVFIELGEYYPQQIPEGYTITFVSNDAPLQNQVIHYENGAGNMIKYWIFVGDPASNIEIYEIDNKTDVDIEGQPGILYEQKGGSRLLVWINEQQGYGFALLTDDSNVDIFAMAKSTAEGELLQPTRTPETLQALEELGDFSPRYLPEGFEELNVAGSPLAEGGWYSYVRKWYVNKADNTSIYLEYESYSIVTEKGYTDDARTACSFYIPGYHILKGETVGEEVEIGGMFGIVTDSDIAWADPENHRVFHLYSKDVTGQELLQVAQSISDQP